MQKRRIHSKLALHAETIRRLSNDQLQGVVGAGSMYTRMPSCSTDGTACQNSASYISDCFGNCVTNISACVTDCAC